MKNDYSISLKALFLLIVFLLNMVVGFACVVESEEAHVHILHKSEAVHQHKESDHMKGGDHTHSDKDKDNCCKDEVVELLKADKLSPGTTSVVYPIAFIELPAFFYQYDAIKSFTLSSGAKYYIRGRHLPIPDIRISIQSFQI